MASTRIADHIGRVLGSRYRLSAAIGTGASAHVFLAEDVRLARRVAVKMLHPALADDAAFLRRFQAEARAVAALSHAHVMAVYDWGEEPDGPFIVMEFLGGGSLRAMLDRGNRLTPSQALLVGLEAARGLDYAHRRGLVHRDIKPANLLFDEDGNLKIADFGLARALAEAAWTEPTGAVLGTARYAAPEQVRGTPLDGKADVYALAVVLVEAVTGRVPFAADTTVGTILSRLERPLEVPDELGALAPILTKAGQPDPADRPDAMAFGAVLHGLAPKMPSPTPLPLAGPAMFDGSAIAVDRDPTEMGVAAASEPTVLDLPRTEAEPKATDESRPPASVAPPPAPPGDGERRRRRRWPWVVVALLMVLGGSAAALALVQNQVPSHPVPDLAAMNEADAVLALRALEFEPVVRKEYADGTVEGKILSQTPAPLQKLKEGRRVTFVVSQGSTPVNVPDLGNVPHDQATAALEKAGLLAGEVTREYSEEIANGRVIDWNPKGEARRGWVIALKVSRGPLPRTIPETAGMSYEQAAKAVADAGLTPTRDSRYDDEVPADKVIGTRPPVGNVVDRGTSVTVVVSRGQPAVPNLDGMTEAQARAALEAVDLKLGNVFGLGGKVFRQTVDAGTRVKRGTAVSVFII